MADNITLAHELRNIERSLRAGLSLYERISNIESNIETALRNIGISDASAIPTKAENADNLRDAISCYMQYGEYDVDSLIDEITRAAKQ